jgi:hypothetical protein
MSLEILSLCLSFCTYGEIQYCFALHICLYFSCCFPSNGIKGQHFQLSSEIEPVKTLEQLFPGIAQHLPSRSIKLVSIIYGQKLYNK